jgi:hypothetical protein
VAGSASPQVFTGRWYVYTVYYCIVSAVERILMSPAQIVALLNHCIGRAVRFECINENSNIDGYVGKAMADSLGSYLFIVPTPMAELGNTVGLPSSNIEPRYYGEYMVFEYISEHIGYRLTLHSPQ